MRPRAWLWPAPLLLAVAWWTYPGTDRASTHVDARREAAIRGACSECHAFPPPDILPRDAWPDRVRGMHELATRTLMNRRGPLVPGVSEDRVVAWFQDRAPERLHVAPRQTCPGDGPLRFRRRGLDLPGRKGPPQTTHVRRVRVLDDPQPQLAVCEVGAGRLYLLQDLGGPPIASFSVGQPAHAESADLNGDGRPDLVVADLGSLAPTEEAVGRVLVLWNRGSLTFESQVVLKDVGRVADVRPLDRDGDGDLDLAVASFGWRQTGGLYLLENRSGRGGDFPATTLDERTGAVSMVTGLGLDLDPRPEPGAGGRSLPDLAVLFAQQHETLTGFRALGMGQYADTTIYRAPHPAWGSSNLEVVDLDLDGDLDLLMSHGDTLDEKKAPYKPYHGIHWLENQGGGRFEPREVGRLHAVHRAEAGDLDGDGDLDVVACAFLPQFDKDPAPAGLRVESVVWFERVEDGWVPWSIEAGHPFHPSLTLADVDLDGDLDIVTAVARPDGPPSEAALEIWENLGPR